MKHESKLPRCRGVYLLVLRVLRDIEVSTRSRGFSVTRGYYVYVGSARGPGGLFARVKRHIEGLKTLFWHIDYLLSNPLVSVEAVCFRCVEADLETVYARGLGALCRGVPGFGCSDKRGDYSHLYECGGCLEEVYEKIKRLDAALSCLDRSMLDE